MEATAPITPLVPVTPPGAPSQAPAQAPATTADPAPAPAPQAQAQTTTEAQAATTQQAPATPTDAPAGTDTGSAESAPDPVAAAKQVIELQGMLGPVLSDAYTKILGAARSLEQSGQKMPEELSNIFERMKMISKLTDTEVKVLKDAPIAPEVAADPMAAAMAAQNDVIKIIQSLIVVGSQASEQLPADKLPEDVGKPFSAALEKIGQLPMTLWAVGKLMPMPEPAESKEQATEEKPAG